MKQAVEMIWVGGLLLMFFLGPYIPFTVYQVRGYYIHTYAVLP
jgi:hypothetical protein